MDKIAIISANFNTDPELLHQHFFSIVRHNIDLKDRIVHIVVDDCSTNMDSRTALFVNCEANKNNTILIAKKENTGPGATRNRAIELIEKMNDVKYICLLDADDYLEKDSLYIRAALLEADKEVIAVYGNKYTARMEMKLDEIDETTHLTEVSKTLEEVPTFDRQRLLRECYIPSCSVMFRAEPFLKYIKRFREDVRLCEDWLIWRKLSFLGKFKKIDIPMYTQTIHGKNLTQTKAVLDNHLRDMILTQGDLQHWCETNRDIIQ